jgi:putative ABC transport system permease protein
LIFVAACLGVSAMLLASIRERRREIQLLRIIGAPPYVLFLLIQLEAFIITLISCILGATLLVASLVILQGYLVLQYGVYIDINLLTDKSLTLMGCVLLASMIAALIPSFSGYRKAKISSF